MNHVQDVKSVDVNQSGSIITVAHGDQVDALLLFQEVQSTIFKSQQMTIHHVTSSPDSQTVIICSNQEKPAVIKFDKISDISKFTKLQNVPEDEDGFVFCAVDPKNMYYAFVSFSRTLYIWNKEKIVHKIPNAIDKNVTRAWLTISPESLPIKVSWTNDSKYLIIPSNNVINFISTSNWKVAFSLSTTYTSYQAVLSDNDRYLAVSQCDKSKGILSLFFQGKDGQYINIEDIKFDTPLTNIQFHKSSDLICASTFDGNLHVIKNFLKDVSSTKIAAKLEIKVPPKLSASQLLDKDSMDESNSDEDSLDIKEPSENLFDGKKNIHKKFNEEQSLDQESSEEAEDEDLRQAPRPISKKNIIDNSSDDEIAFSDKDSIQNSPKSIQLGGSPLVKGITLSKGQIIQQSTLQPSFQPGATQLHDGKRYLCYNHIGFIKVSTIPGQENQYYEVEYHDSLSGSSGTIEKYNRFQLADLAEGSYILASRGDLVNPSTIFYKSTKNDIQWEYTLPDDEQVDVVSILNNGETVAIATTESLSSTGDFKTYSLRLFSGSGAQTATIDLEGRVITMTGRNNNLAISYYNQLGQKQYIILQTKDGRILQQGNLTLTTYSDLTWMGYDENNLLYTADSSGIVRVLSMDHWKQWIRVASLHVEGEHTHVFYISMRSIFFTRSTSPNISVLPPPTIQHTPFSLKLLNSKTNGDNLKNIKYEQEFIIGNLIVNAHKRDIVENNSIDKAKFMLQESKQLSDLMIEMDKNLLRLLEECLLTDSNALKHRILEFAPFFNKKQSIEFAKQIAHNQKQKKIENQLLGIQKKYFGQNADTTDLSSKRALPSCARDYDLIFNENLIQKLQTNNQNTNNIATNGTNYTNGNSHTHHTHISNTNNFKTNSLENHTTIEQETEDIEMGDASPIHNDMDDSFLNQHTPGRPPLFSPKKQKRPSEIKRNIFAKRSNETITKALSNNERKSPFESFEPEVIEIGNSALESLERQSKVSAFAKRVIQSATESESQNTQSPNKEELVGSQSSQHSSNHSSSQPVQSTIANILKRKRDVEKENFNESNKRNKIDSKQASIQKSPPHSIHKSPISPVGEASQNNQESEKTPELITETIEISLSERKKLQLPKSFDATKFKKVLSTTEDSDSDGFEL